MGSIPTSAVRDMFMTEISWKRRKSLKRFTKKKKKKKKIKKNGPKVMGSIPTSATRDMFMTEISLKRRKSLKRFTKKKKKKKINNLESMARRLWVRIPLAPKDMTEISVKVKEIK